MDDCIVLMNGIVNFFNDIDIEVSETAC